MVLSVIMVPYLVHWTLVVVLPGLMPVEHQLFVVYVALEHTTTKRIKLLAKIALPENIKTKRGSCFATTIVVLDRISHPTTVHVWIAFLVNTKIRTSKTVAKTIALLEHTSFLIRLPVWIVQQVNGKIKTIN
jgi:hypothetical protein